MQYVIRPAFPLKHIEVRGLGFLGEPRPVDRRRRESQEAILPVLED